VLNDEAREKMPKINFHVSVNASDRNMISNWWDSLNVDCKSQLIALWGREAPAIRAIQKEIKSKLSPVDVNVENVPLEIVLWAGVPLREQREDSDPAQDLDDFDHLSITGDLWPGKGLEDGQRLCDYLDQPIRQGFLIAGRTFHAGCTAHPCARVCLTQQSIPAAFSCPLNHTQTCPIQAFSKQFGGHAVQLYIVAVIQPIAGHMSTSDVHFEEIPV
jgi:hypothetical protein